MATSINQNQIVSDGAMFYRDTNGNVMCTHHSNGAISSNDGSGNSAARKRPWFKYHASTTETTSTTTTHARDYSAHLSGSGQVGDCFNTSNGRFTAPRAGIYLFTIDSITNSGGTDNRHALYVNATYHSRRNINTSQYGGSHNNRPATYICNMAEGDWAAMADHEGSKSHENSWNHFSGTYIGPYGG